MRIAGLVVAGGSGERAGAGVAKQFRRLGGLPMIRRSIAALTASDSISEIQVVIGVGQEALHAAATEGLRLRPAVEGGVTRAQSVRRGLEALAPSAPDLVLIHDAARPLASRALIERVIAALKSGAAAAIPLLPVTDSLKRRDGNQFSSLPRDAIYRAQTPQGFRFVEIRRAHAQFADRNVTDDMALAELAGMGITAVEGEERNMKITTAEDLALAERLIRGGEETRTGFGFDAHRFVAGDHIWLCGVRLAHDRTLEGHSDADAGLHALTDSLLGALGAGDIGAHFPPTDERWRGASSAMFLAHAARLVAEAGGAIVHCDVTLITERPKIAPHVPAMRTRIAEILGLDSGRISVKATTTEGMGFTGRGEGLAAQAVATIRLPAP